MNKVRTSFLCRPVCEKIFELAIESGSDYGVMGAKIIGLVPTRKCSPQLRYHYADLVDTAYGTRISIPDLERIRDR